ncbi:MAG: hypothetical protein MKZ56_03650, partial [Candidatus Thalassarchaeum sp.]|nr:hypothetical protein [Candidatus Thalassarchaeum sp.]
MSGVHIRNNVLDGEIRGTADEALLQINIDPVNLDLGTNCCRNTVGKFLIYHNMTLINFDISNAVVST